MDMYSRENMVCCQAAIAGKPAPTKDSARSKPKKELKKGEHMPPEV